MKNIRIKIIYFIIVIVLLFSCSKPKENIANSAVNNTNDSNNNMDNPKENSSDTTSNTDDFEHHNTLDVTNSKDNNLANIEASNDFALAALQQFDSLTKVIDTLGEPINRSYSIRGTYLIHNQFLVTNLHYPDVIISIHDFFTAGYEEIEGVVEINIIGNQYKTSRGIKVGDTLEAVKAAYEFDAIYNLIEDSSDNVVNDIYQKINHMGWYTHDLFDYQYGINGVAPSSLAYITAEFDEETGIYPPVLVFLFQEDKVTNIVLFNSLFLHV